MITALRLAILVVILCQAATVWGAVTFDTTFEKGLGGATTPFSFVSNAGTVSGSVGSNANRVLIAVVGFSLSAALIGTVTMTWAGQSMTQITTLSTAGNRPVYVFGLIAPASGAQTISVAWSNAAQTPDLALGAVSLYNADQSTGWSNATTSGPTTSAAPSITVTTTTGGMAVTGRADDNSSTPWSVTAGTLAWSETNFNGNYGQAYRANNAGSTVVTWSIGSSVSWAMVGVNVIASVSTIGLSDMIGLGDTLSLSVSTSGILKKNVPDSTLFTTPPAGSLQRAP